MPCNDEIDYCYRDCHGQNLAQPATLRMDEKGLSGEPKMTIYMVKEEEIYPTFSKAMS